MITHIKRLKESLTVLQLLAGALPSNDAKFSNKYSDIGECFSKLIDSLINDVKKYLKFEPENSDCVIQIANKYEQIFQIYEAAEIIKVDSNLKKDVGADWIESIKKTLLKIQTASEQFNGKLMTLSDYRDCENFY
jgi:hypothetical protein